VPPRGPHWKHLGLGGLGLLAAGWLFGLLTFVRADGHFEASLPRRRGPSPGTHNLARWDQGPTVRASSYFGDWSSHHHPFFLVDGRDHPDLMEKWASAERDGHPWIEILWREPHDLERVVLRHAGSVEAAEMTARTYHIRCLLHGSTGPKVDVYSNDAAVAEHRLACAGARGVRIEFDRDGGDIIRLFEVETWGR
jgi:hypothetical protein